MKDKIEQAARQRAIDRLWHPDMMETKRVGNEIIKAYIEGANYVLNQYNGITPEQVKQLIEALNTCHNALSTYGSHPIIDNQINQTLKQHNK